MNNWKIHLVCLALLLGPGAFAQEASEEILDLQTKAFLALEQGKEMVEAKQFESALSAYQRALAIYRAIRQKDPNFKKEMLDWRVSLCGNEIKRLTAEIQRANPNAAPAPASTPARPDGLPPPPPFSPTPINGAATQPIPEPVAQPAPRPRPAPRQATRIPEPAPRPQSPELQAEAADLEYMSKYISLLDEMKDLKKKMVSVQTREETTNLAILRQKKELETMTKKHDDMQKTIEKMTGRNADLLDGLDASKAELTTTTTVKEDLETEVVKLKSSLTTAEQKLEVNEAKLRTLENEFQDNKKKISSNNRKVSKMETERDAETERANALAVEVAKLKSDLAKQKESSESELAELESQYASSETDLDKELKETKKSLATARKRNTDMLSDYELAQAELDTLTETVKQLQSTNELASVHAQLTELKSDHETNLEALAEKESQLKTVEEDLMRLEELETLYASAEKENDALKIQIDEQEKRLTAAADDGGMEKQVKILIAEKADLSTELDDLKDSHALMTVDLNGNIDALESALSDREKALVRIKELQVNVAKTRQDKGAADARVKLLENSLAESQSALADAQKDAGGWVDEKTDLEKMHARVLADQEKDMQALRSELRETQHDTDSWKDKHAVLSTELSDAKKSLADATKSAGGWLKEKTAMERSHASALTDLNKDLQEVRSELQDAQENSTGWKEKHALVTATLMATEKSLADATKSAGGWLKEKTAMERSHASALTDLNKDLQEVRDDLHKAHTGTEDWKSKTEVATLALKAEKKAMADLVKNSGSSTRTIAGLQKSVADLKSDVAKKDAELTKIKGTLAETARVIRAAKTEREKLVSALNEATSEKEKTASDLVRERDEALKQLQAKEAEISELKKKGTRPSDQPMRRRSARMNDIVPVPVLEQLSQLSPLVNIRAKGENGLAVEYQGVGTINLVLPE